MWPMSDRYADFPTLRCEALGSGYEFFGFGLPEAREGVAALREKRPPQFRAAELPAVEFGAVEEGPR